MRGKLVLLTGVAIGYVLGARAGRERYEQIKRVAGKLWNDPRVQQQRHNVEEFAKDKAPDVVEYLSESAKKVVKRKPAAETSTSSSTGSRAKASPSARASSQKK